MAKLTKKQLRERGIYNSHNFCWRGMGFLFLRAGEHHNWLVAGLDAKTKTDPNAPWYNNGCKAFFGEGSGSRERSADALCKAKAWASEHYGITAWERDPFGGWQDARAYDAVMGARREKPNAKESKADG